MPGDNLANLFQKQLRRWLLAEAAAREVAADAEKST
jgi:hypothetical protein